jgi:hypothetical protein
MSANVILLDRILARDGPETKGARVVAPPRRSLTGSELREPVHRHAELRHGASNLVVLKSPLAAQPW